MDELVGSLLHSLFLHQQLLIELLARSEAGVLNFDVHIRLVTGQADHVPRHGVDLHRLAHVQNENLAALGIVSRLKHQTHRLGDGHEIPDDVGMGDGHGAAGLDLLLKERNDAAVAAQDIPEAHRHEFRFGLPVHHLHHHLAQALGRAHDVGGVDGLVGGYLHEPLDAVLRGGFRQLVGADDVVLDGLVGAFLHQRDVLVCRSVEHKLRPVGFHHMVQPDGITDRANDNLQIQLRMGAAQLHLNIIGIIFVNIQNNKLLRLRVGDLTAQLAADAAAAAGDQHHLAGNVAHDLV